MSRGAGSAASRTAPVSWTGEGPFAGAARSKFSVKLRLRGDAPEQELTPDARLTGLDTMRFSTEVLPLLADALEEAGCDDRVVLDHCRGPGPHARGCWVVDLVLE